jgi:hypothetical protein
MRSEHINCIFTFKDVQLEMISCSDLKTFEKIVKKAARVAAVKEHRSEECKKQVSNNVKGDALEILAEFMFRNYGGDNHFPVDRNSYEILSGDGDYGVDAIGTYNNGPMCVQVKFRSDPTRDITYTEIAKTTTRAILNHKIPVYDSKGKDLTSKSIIFFTNANKYGDHQIKTGHPNPHLINRKMIDDKTRKSKSFWDDFYYFVYGEKT